ncbi:hypothetical protein V8F20_003650 [Naviculisporaceae sp. PSN 640]
MADGYYTVEDGDVPPSYFEAVSPRPSNLLPQPTGGSSISPAVQNGILPSSVTGSLTSPLTAHLHNLPIRMRANQQARATEQASRDLDIITLLAPHVEKFLTDLGSLDRIPSRAELTLVPGTIVPRGAKMSDAAERRREGEIVRVVRVEFLKTKSDSGADSKGKGNPSQKGGSSSRNNRGNVFDDSDDDGSGSSEPAFDEWGRFDTEEASTTKEDPYFFRDEAMARRLAAYLRPRPEPNLDRRHIQAAVANGGSAPSWGWGWLGKKQQEKKAASVAPPRSTNSPLLSPGDTERADMTVKVENVCFRIVNDFGIYESLSGWGIVVTVKIRR